jgi:hypothetical protein
MTDLLARIQYEESPIILTRAEHETLMEWRAIAGVITLSSNQRSAAPADCGGPRLIGTMDGKELYVKH